MKDDSDAVDLPRKTTGWTGGQYSILRAATAVLLFFLAIEWNAQVEGLPAAILTLIALGACALAMGWRDRAVTLNLILLLAGYGYLESGQWPFVPSREVAGLLALLVLHLTTPVAPFGSWDSRGRLDPRGDWHRSHESLILAWVLVVAFHGERAASELGAFTGLFPHEAALPEAAFAVAVVSGALALFFAIGLFADRLRPYAWTALVLWEVARVVASVPDSSEAPLLLLLAFACDPGWWPGRSRTHGATTDGDPANADVARLFYDGTCGFCQNSVRIVLAEELGTPETIRLRFAPLEGERFAAEIARRADLDRETLPDSIILILEDGQLLTRSAAALEIATRLGGGWRGLARALGLVPAFLLDAAYDAVARIRKKLAADPKEACPILPPDLRARFDY